MGENRARTDQFQLRLPIGLRDELKLAAAQNERSMTSEIIARLQGSSNSASNSLTKREHYAGLAMQGLLASPHFIDPDGLWTGNGAQPTAEAAVLLADALIAELAKGVE